MFTKLAVAVIFIAQPPTWSFRMVILLKMAVYLSANTNSLAKKKSQNVFTILAQQQYCWQRCHILLRKPPRILPDSIRPVFFLAHFG